MESRLVDNNGYPIDQWYTGPVDTAPGPESKQGGGGGQDLDAMRQEILNWFRELLAREPTEDEINEALRHYQGAGLDIAKEYIVSLREGHGGSGGGGGQQGGGFGKFDVPSFDAPSFNAPAPFEYPDFIAPTGDAVTADPGYQFRAKNSEQTLLNARSAEGLSRTGGFLKELATWKSGLDAQEYGNVYNRRFGEWQAGYNTKAQDYERAWRQALTDYTLRYQSEMDEFTRAAQSYGLNLDAHNSNFGNMATLYGLMMQNLPTYTPLQMPALG